MIEIILILATLGVDQLTKMWAAGSLAAMEGGIFDLVPGVFRLRYVENRGAAFGMLQGQAWLFYILTGGGRRGHRLCAPLQTQEDEQAHVHCLCPAAVGRGGKFYRPGSAGLCPGYV